MRWRLVPSFLVVAAVAMAGCAGGDDGAGPATSLDASTTTEGGEAAQTTMVLEETTTTADEAVSRLVLRGDGLGVVALGASTDAAIAAVSSDLGAPSLDTGWESSFSTYGTCPGEQIRGVEWDGLVLLFTDGTTPYGSGEHLFSWRITGAPPAVGTATGLGFGASVADAEELHPGAVEVVPPEEPFPGFLEIEADGGPITAFLDGEVISNLEAGAPCGE
jgi:hypothetical protein